MQTNREEDDDVDPEDPDESDMDQDDGPALIACPYCKTALNEEAEMCPKCGNFISGEEAPFSARAWIVVGAVLCLIVILLFWLR